MTNISTFGSAHLLVIAYHRFPTGRFAISMKRRFQIAMLCACGLFSIAANAQVPERIEAELRDLGTTIDPLTIAALYHPLHGITPNAGVTVIRNQSYGPDPRNVLDVFSPREPRRSRDVLIFLPGGLGDKIETFPNGEVFYDNVMWWAARQGMVGVNVQRRGAMRDDRNGEDVGMALRWIHEHIASYGGNRNRLFVWGYSSGAMSLADYLARPQFQRNQGVLVRGAVLMSGPYNLAPIEVPDGGGLRLRLGKDGTVQGMPPMPPATPEEMRRDSVLPGLRAAKLPLLLLAAERDPPLLLNSAVLLNDELRKAGRKPGFRILKQHNHSSEIFSVNTDDVSVTEPLLEWIRSVR
jgi:triacylglycerol lipase